MFEQGGSILVGIVSSIVGLLAGGFGKTLLDRWFERDKQRTELKATSESRDFEDNEQARRWLHDQLAERDAEVAQLRTSERGLLERVGHLAEQVARHDERSQAQAAQIQVLSDSVAKLGDEYTKLEAERNLYRDQKHEVDNKLAGAVLRANLAERDVVARDQEIERLRGQLAVKLGPVRGETP
jgi:chromosome segregation ATPase